MAHVLVVDNDQKTAVPLKAYLADSGFKTALVSSGEEGLQTFVNDQFDAVLLDVVLPRISGLDLLRQLRQISSIPIIVLTTKCGDVERVIGLEMGADDYIAKPFYPREVVARLHAVLRRRPSGDRDTQTMLALNGLGLDPARRKATWERKAFALTMSEFDMLHILVRAGDIVVTKDRLSESVLGRKHEPHDRSIDVHIGNLRRKLAAVSSGRIKLETVRGVGYRVQAEAL